MAGVNGALSECDLIIDTTANPTVLNHLTAVSLSSGNSLVWGGVYAGGIGGYIARSRPEKEPTPHLVRQALNDFYETIDTAPPVATHEGYDGQDSGDVFIASDVDVSLLAVHLTSFALDTLIKAEPSDFDAPIYILGFRRAWEFDSAFHVQPISVEAPLRPLTVLQQKDPVQTEFVDGLLKKKLYEIAHQKKET